MQIYILYGYCKIKNNINYIWFNLSRLGYKLAQKTVNGMSLIDGCIPNKYIQNVVEKILIEQVSID